MADLAGIRARALATLAPPPVMDLSAWIEANIVLPSGLSAVSGPIRLYDYQREIADCIGDPEIERVTLQKSARIGFSALVAAAIGHYCRNEPSPVLLVLPTQDDCRSVMTGDIENMFSASPALHGILATETVGQRGKSRNTILSRRFPGGSLRIVAAKAPRNLRAHTAAVLFVDECDAMENGAEGSPIELAEKRTLTFSSRKIVLGSTPLFEDTSHICRAYQASDMRKWEIPCPACGCFHSIAWADIAWPPGEPELAKFLCPHCNELIAEDDYKAAPGRWRATQDVKGHAGFKLSALSSTLKNASWGRIAREFLAAKDDPALLQVWVNTTLGDSWRSIGEDLDTDSLASRVEDFSLDKIPESVLVITAGCDVQDDRIEISFAGWAKDGTCYVLAHTVLYGPTVDDRIWIDLDDTIKQRWAHPLGGTISVDAAAVDAGDGGAYDKVLKFCTPRWNRRVFATKGTAGFARPAFKQSAALKGQASQRLYIIGVDAIKSILFQRLQRAQTIRFSNTLGPEYFEQLASERRVIKYMRGRPEPRFERVPGRRAETLDCWVMAYAAREGCAIALDTREQSLRLNR
jgi:phage terminase large subunit GpA-like protein